MTRTTTGTRLRASCERVVDDADSTVRPAPERSGVGGTVAA